MDHLFHQNLHSNTGEKNYKNADKNLLYGKQNQSAFKIWEKYYQMRFLTYLMSLKQPSNIIIYRCQ